MATRISTRTYLLWRSHAKRNVAPGRHRGAPQPHSNSGLATPPVRRSVHASVHIRRVRPHIPHTPRMGSVKAHD